MVDVRAGKGPGIRLAGAGGQEQVMQIEGIHHISSITSDARANVDFYARVLGLRMVKKTVNQDDPTVYHLFYADEAGSPGADMTFFEYPGARRGRAGAGMIHEVAFRVGSPAALDFWAARLGDEGISTSRYATGHKLTFTDPEGLGLALVVSAGSGVRADTPLVARSLGVPAEHAIQGFDGVRAYVADPARSEVLLSQVLGAEAVGEHHWELRGESRGGTIQFDAAPGAGVQGAGTVHHIAWSIGVGEEDAWRAVVTRAGMRPTPPIDRYWFNAVYFREPSGILYELATRGPGFTVDEPLESLGQALVLPPTFEPQRERIEPRLTPLPDTTQWRPTA